MNDIAYFNSYSTAAGNYTLYKTNGTSLLAEVVLLPADGGPSGLGQLVAGDDVLFFEANSPSAGAELWRSDGYPWATATVDVNPGSQDCNLRNITVIGDTAYFHGTNGADGSGLYRFPSGTSAGVHQHGDPFALRVHATAIHGGRERCDLLRGLRPPAPPVRSCTGATALPEAPPQLKDINPGTNDGLTELSVLRVVGDSLYFLAVTPANGQELWVSDGTEAGTVMVQDRNPVGNESFMPEDLTLVGNMLFMRGTINSVPNQFFKLDLDWVTGTEEPGKGPASPVALSCAWLLRGEGCATGGQPSSLRHKRTRSTCACATR